MTLLVFGRTGQVATELARLAARDGRDAVFLDRAAADLTRPADCAAAIAAQRPRAAINAAAYTAVDRAEDEAQLATTINAEAPRAMARACAALEIPLLHISTDYVFDGGGETPWRPQDPIRPLNAYGRSKAAGEAAIAAEGGRYAILRTSWVFSAHGANFVTTMLRLSETRDALDVVEDQIGGPTPAAGIAAALMTMTDALLEGHSGGIYHYAGAPAVSWAGFARETFAQAGRAVTVTGIPGTAWPTPAPRPRNSRLDCSATTHDFGIPPADWQAALGDVLKELLP